MIPLFDLHCDTFSEIYKASLKLTNSKTQISTDKLTPYSPYIQVAAIWSDCRLSDDQCYFQCLKNIEYIKSLDPYICTNASRLRPLSFILGIEDARLLSNDLSRLDKLYDMGVRVLTLNWQGISVIGGGWDTDLPLTDFGIEVVKRACELGIIIDISHSSIKAQMQIIAIAKEIRFSPIASHSCSFTVNPHKRNINDEVFSELIALSGIVGINLVAEHLSSAKCALFTVIEHIEHFLVLGGENFICLGCDFDGTDNLPIGINSIYDLKALYNAIYKEFGGCIANKIFFYNAYDYFLKHLK